MRTASTTRKVLLAVYGTLLTLSVVLIAWLHHTTRRDLREEAIARLGSITSTLAAQMDGGRVTRLLQKYDSQGMLIKNTQDAWYYIMHETLRKSAGSNALELPLVVVAFDQEKDELQLVATSAPKPAFRSTCTGPNVHDLIAYLGSGRVDPGSHLAEEELSAFTALRDARGYVTAAVVASLPGDDVAAAARAALARNVIAAAVIFLLTGLFLFRSVGRWVKHEEDEHHIWQQRHEGMNESIANASRLQHALIPKPEVFSEQFDLFFVINRPKEIVSGDFHWYHRLDDDRCLVALADCTGHGVPGAMMATLGCSLLNDVVLQDPWRDPAEILHHLNQRMTQSLHQNGQRKGAGDGMDVALCRIDRHQREIIFAGAMRPLYWVHAGQLTVINGDRMPIGGSHFDPDRRFTGHRVAYHPGDRIYLFSDGYVDQFGGPQRKKFMVPRFNALLLSQPQLGLDAQADLLVRVFEEWKGKEEQVDDVCVVGLEM